MVDVDAAVAAEVLVDRLGAWGVVSHLGLVRGGEELEGGAGVGDGQAGEAGFLAEGAVAARHFEGLAGCWGGDGDRVLDVSFVMCKFRAVSRSAEVVAQFLVFVSIFRFVCHDVEMTYPQWQPPVKALLSSAILAVVRKLALESR